ncbi:hypothetical protein M513_02097 [Trichuris suis]|uniref:Uncharacterized protein n=1 Tax=Trichuris suis TaxID=68888 RepID=A0A085MHZ4_9BILA|nr:hypothetical protein M513_02097 [Trichuris suis]
MDAGKVQADIIIIGISSDSQATCALLSAPILFVSLLISNWSLMRQEASTKTEVEGLPHCHPPSGTAVL